MQQTAQEPTPTPDGEQGVESDNNEQKGFADTATNDRTGPLTGEANERDPAWRPGDAPPGEGVYDHSNQTETVGDEQDREGVE